MIARSGLHAGTWLQYKAPFLDGRHCNYTESGHSNAWVC